MSKLTVTRRLLSSLLCFVVATCFVVLSARTASADQDHKIQICHKGQTIEVDVHAVPAHLDHGDLLGPCGGTPGCACGQDFDPVRCADGKIYANQCQAENAGCTGPFVKLCACGLIYAPVRCADGVIYVNACVAQCQGATGCSPIQ